MSRRNSREAKASRRRQGSRAAEPGYPVMPPSTCYGSSTILAACYPELRYAEGIRTWTVRDGRSVELEHAWNVNTATGEIWDATLSPTARMLAGSDYGELTYTEGQSTLEPGAFAGWCSVAVEATAGQGWEAKRAALEWVGQALASLPCDCPDVGPDGCRTHGKLAPVTAS